MGTFAFDVYYAAPVDEAREQRILGVVGSHSGRLDFRELPDPGRSVVSNAVCLTYEFDDFDTAVRAEAAVRAIGEHAEGVYEYG